MLLGLLRSPEPSRRLVREPVVIDVEPEHLLREPAKIATALRDLQERRSLLTVAIAGSDDYLTSSILEVNSAREYLVLDEFVPAEGASLVAPGKRIYIRGRLSGITVSFGSHIEATEDGDGQAYYKVPFPDELEYQQRRENHRVIVPIEKSVSICLFSEHSEKATGELRDLSLSGMSARLNPGHPFRHEVGDIIPTCIIDLDPSTRIQGALEVRYREPSTELKRARIGGRFLNLERRSERVLEALVAAIDREHARKGIV